MHRTAVAPVAEGTILIGDAAGYLDKTTGDGISLTISQAKALDLKPYCRLTRLVLLLVRYLCLVDPAFAILGQNQKLFQRMITV